MKDPAAKLPDWSPDLSRALFDGLNDPACVFDRDGLIVFVNRRATEVFGYTAEQFRGQHVLTPTPPEDRENLLPLLEAIFRDGHAEFECRALAGDGRLFDAAVSVRILDWELGFAVGTVRDVTKERRAYKELISTLTDLERLASAVDRSPAVLLRWRVVPGIWPVDFVSEGIRQFGYTPEDFTRGRVSWPEITHPEDEVRLEKEVSRYLSEGCNEWSQKYRLRDADGKWRWVEDRNVVIRDDRGEVVEIEGLVLDVTERVSAEQCLEAAVSDGWVPMVLFDREGRIEAFNRAATDLFGYTPTLMARVQDVIPLLFVHPGETERALSVMRKRMAGTDLPAQTYRGKNLKTGEDRFVRVHTVAYANGYITQFIDLTERHQLEKAVVDIAEHERRRFGHDVHDVLGQDLAGLLFTAGALRKQSETLFPQATAELERMCNLISESIKRAKKLARGMCLMGSEHVDLGEALRDLARETEEVFSTSCKVRVQGKVADLDVGVASQLYQIAREATLNAVRHAAASRISLGLHRKNAKLTLTIDDDGTGFATHNVEVKGGLGLMIMAHRAELAGAQLEIDSIEKRGTRVKCELRNVGGLVP